MATGRRFAENRLPLTLAFTVLVVVAVGVSCKGFFPPNSLSSIAIQPPSPQVQVGQSTGLQAWGTYLDNSKSQLTSGVVWTTSDNTTVSIDQNTGEITGEGSGGTATITAAAQGISATATATSFLPNVTGLTVCTGTFNTGTCPAPTWTISGTSGGHQSYYAKATSNGTTVDVTTVATWAVSPTATNGSVTCDASLSPATCTVDPGTTTGPYVITVTYPNVPSVTANITVD
ncbi:MAG: Ig-like domain-containing protein [Terriglobales bacterium]